MSMGKCHADLTGLLCENLALAYGFSEREASQLHFASSYHDIGKSLIPEHILNKPGKLTPSEFNIIKLHTAYGYNLLQSVCTENGDIMRQIAMYHHERYDGKGYWSMERDKQPHYMRIVTIVDVLPL